MWLRVGPAAGSCEKGNETSGSTKRGEFLEWLRNCELIREDSAPVEQLVRAWSLDKLWKAKMEEKVSVQTRINFKERTVHSPTDAHLLELRLKFTLKLDGSYTFRSTTIIRELAIEPG